MWTYCDNGKEYGPFTTEERVEIDSVRTNSATYVWIGE